MVTKYQLVLIGNSNDLKDTIIDTFKKRVQDLGVNEDALSILDEKTFEKEYKRNAPSAALYFGGRTANFPDLVILDDLLSNSSFILPVVGDLARFTDLVPKQLFPINGFELKSEREVEALVSNILECLGLLRLARRLFISYKRNESRSVAIQLFEKLEQAGFDVFLDTHSVRPGDTFQDELWHRLVDTDVVVLLNSPGFLESEWTTEEVAKASAMSVGILQLVWPNHSPERMSELSQLLYLKEGDFENKTFAGVTSHLLDSANEKIIEQVESLRARSLAARQDNIIAEFMSAANSLNVNANLQREKFITVGTSDDKEVVLIPTVGVPHAFTYNQSEELIKRIRKNQSPQVSLLYDHRNIREKWLTHLAWLDGYLPVSSLKITEIEQWLRKI
jgi:hypothetical protein